MANIPTTVILNPVVMASNETGAPPQATNEKSARWSSKLSFKLTRYVSGRGAVAVRNQAKVDVALRACLFVFSLVAVVVMVSSKQTAKIPISPAMTIRVDAKFTHSASFTYFVSAFSVIGLYSMITGYSSYSALKKQEHNAMNQLHFLLLDSLILSIATSATGAGGGVAYEALKGNPHIRWMKICHIFDTFCDHLASAGAMSLLASITLLLLIWLGVCAIVRNSGR